MGSPLRKSRVVANDWPSTPPVVLPLPIVQALPKPVPRVVPYVLLAPTPPPGRDFSWMAFLAVCLLGATLCLLGAAAGTVFWFTYDSVNIEPVASSPVMARLAETPPVVPLQSPPQPIPQPVAPEDIVLPAMEAPPVSSPPANDTTIASSIIIRETEPEDADALLDRARTELEQGEHDTALALYERVLVQAPANRPALEGKAYILGLLPSPASFAELRRMAAAAPDDAVVQVTVAKALASRGEAMDAIPYLERAVRLAPGDMAARFDLAILYDRAGREPEALALYRQILQRAGDSEAPLLPSATLDAIRRRAEYLAAAHAPE